MVKFILLWHDVQVEVEDDWKHLLNFGAVKDSSKHKIYWLGERCETMNTIWKFSYKIDEHAADLNFKGEVTDYYVE